VSFTMIGNSLILLQKAYLVLFRQKWILYISTPFIMAQLFFAPIIICYSFFTLEEKVGCMDYYPRNFLWYWFLIDVPINILFSSIFCHVALKQYRLFGSEAWKNLARDGIQTMTLATSCNIICSILIITPLVEINSDSFFTVDWLIVTTILVNHCQNMGKNTRHAHRPKTDHILDLSQVATAKSINH
ncbi:hypothetical protein BDF19DRAFT_437177, partial [Syncephalis fuscata]